jgi:cytoskeletal protein CcmA (bactofilin family)
MAEAPDRDLTGMTELHALLGRGTEFEGKLSFEGRVRIDGRIRGEIFGDGVLIVGPSAEIRASIDVAALIVRGGSIWGDVKAKRSVELYAPARVHGDIATAQLYLDKGVTFEGRSTMLEPSSSKPPPADDEPVVDTEG